MNEIDKSKDFPQDVNIVHESEKNYFDSKAEDIGNIEKENWLVDPADYRATLKLWGFEKGLNGKKVLECGCGTGFFSVLLAKIGARVWSFDLSPKSIELAIERCTLNGVSDRVKASVSAFEDLGYPDSFFDIIVGKNILHHIGDISVAGREIRRLLKEGGRAIFYELSANNPILMFFRRNVIGKARLIPKLGTPDEHPLTDQEVKELVDIFDGHCKIGYPKFRFFGKLDRQVLRQRYTLISFLLEGFDKIIYHCLPPLRKYSYKILLEFTKEQI